MNWNNCFVILLLWQQVSASELSYFDSKINFWNESSAVGKASSLPTKKGDGNFPWEAYKNPNNKEFFKEGDYTPPEPFMEVARNPSDSNIKNWFDYIKTKNEVAARLQVRMQEYLAKNSAQGSDTSAPLAVIPSHNIPHEVDASRFKFRIYFDSHCPHCRDMFQTLARFKNEGFQVEASQVDQDPVGPNERIFPISHANPAELKKHNIKGVPFLLIADMKTQSLLPPIEGFHEYGEIRKLLEKVN